MLKGMKPWLTGIIVGLFTMVATPAFAREVSLKGAGIALWIFIIIGAIIVLLQLIPAIILFFSFIGTSTGLIAKKKASEKVEAEERVILTGAEPAPVKK
jgi:predicted membrane protein